MTSVSSGLIIILTSKNIEDIKKGNLIMSKEFYETRRIFKEYIHFQFPVTFDQWNTLPQDHKAAWLYVQYFNQIISAWYRSKSFYASEQEGVETICQYLLKNVPVIEKNPKRFTPSYIYRVAYNCLYCISHDRVGDRLRYELESSNVVPTSDGELDTFDLIEDERSNPDDYKDDREDLWNSLLQLGQDAIEFASYLIDGGKLPNGVRGKRKEELRSLIESELVQYKDRFYK